MPKPRKKRSTAFKKFIDEQGTTRLSQILKIRDSAIRHWRLGNSLPRPEQMKRIKELTKGQVGYDDIIEGCCSPLSKGRGAR